MKMIEEEKNHQLLNESCLKNAVKFNSALKVVLIPSRGEYKSAGLCPELWWTSSDYFMFQQSAHSEIRLLSAYENINLTAARKKLYQPCGNEAIEDSDSLFETADSIKLRKHVIKNNSDDDIISLNSNNNSNNSNNESKNNNDSKISLENDINSNTNIIKKNNLKRVDSLTHLQNQLKQSDNNDQQNNNNNNNNNNESKPIELSTNNDLLSFCVPLKDTLLLRLECPSRRQGFAKVSINFSMLITYGSLVILIALLILDSSGYLY